MPVFTGGNGVDTSVNAVATAGVVARLRQGAISTTSSAKSSAYRRVLVHSQTWYRACSTPHHPKLGVTDNESATTQRRCGEITEEHFAAPHTSPSLLASCFHHANRSGKQPASAAQVDTKPTARQLAKARFGSRRVAARDRV